VLEIVLSTFEVTDMTNTLVENFFIIENQTGPRLLSPGPVQLIQIKVIKVLSLYLLLNLHDQIGQGCDLSIDLGDEC